MRSARSYWRESGLANWSTFQNCLKRDMSEAAVLNRSAKRGYKRIFTSEEEKIVAGIPAPRIVGRPDPAARIVVGIPPAREIPPRSRTRCSGFSSRPLAAPFPSHLC